LHRALKRLDFNLVCWAQREYEKLSRRFMRAWNGLVAPACSDDLPALERGDLTT
jgi:hypothetical protein